MPIALASMLVVLNSRAGSIDTWKLLSPYPTPHDFYAVAYGNGVFLAIGDRGIVYKSEDGIEWRRAIRVDNLIFRTLAFGNETFVAADDSRLLSSDSGQTWTVRVADTNRLVRKVKFLDGRFYAWGPPGTFLTSINGVNWSPVPGPPGFVPITDIATDGSLIVAVAPQVPFHPEQTPDGTAWISADQGQTWKSNLLAEGFSPNAVAYGAGHFVAVGFERIFASPDGVTWVASIRTFPQTPLRDVRFLNGTFVAVGDKSTILTSTNGVDWSHTEADAVASLFSVTFGRDTFVAVGPLGEVFSSADAHRWVRRSRGTRDSLRGIAYGDGQYVASAYNSLLRSTNAQTWTEIPTSASEFAGVAYGNRRYVAVTGSGLAAVSDDAVNWKTNRIDSTGYAYPIFVSFQNGRFFAGARGCIYSSDDGETWFKSELQPHAAPQVPFESPQFVEALAYGMGRYIAVGGNWLIAASAPVSYTSINGVDWALHSLKSDYVLTGVVFGNGVFVATRYDNSGTGQHIFTSRNGSEWQPQKVPIRFILLVSIAFGRGWFVATDVNGQIVASPDAVNWTKIDQQSAFYSLSCTIFAENRFTVGGGYGTVLQSEAIPLITSPPVFSSFRKSLSGGFQAELFSSSPAILSMEASEDFVTWDNVVTVTSSSASYPIHLPLTSNRLRFFRLRATAP